MLKFRIVILLVLPWVVINVITAQEWDKLNLGINGGRFGIAYAYEYLGLDLSYRLPDFEVALGHNRSFFTHGARMYKYPFMQPEYHRPGYEIAESRRYKGFSFTYLTARSTLNVGHFGLDVEMGPSFQRIRPHKVYDVQRNQKVFRTKKAVNQIGFLLGLGYRYERIKFYWNLHFSEDYFNTRSTIGLSYNIFPIGNDFSEPKGIDFLAKRREKLSSVFHIYLRFRHDYALSKTITSPGTKLEVGANMRLTEKFTLFGTLGLVGWAIGADNINPSYIYLENQILNATKLGDVNYHQLGLLRTDSLNDITNFEYGLGLVLLKYQGQHWVWYEEGENQDIITKQMGGVSIKSQVRLGMFENGVELIVPLGKFPPIISYYWSIGLNFRKKGAKFEKKKKPNIYERTPGWQ